MLAYGCLGAHLTALCWFVGAWVPTWLACAGSWVPGCPPGLPVLVCGCLECLPDCPLLVCGCLGALTALCWVGALCTPQAPGTLVGLLWGVCRWAVGLFGTTVIL